MFGLSSLFIFLNNHWIVTRTLREAQNILVMRYIYMFFMKIYRVIFFLGQLPALLLPI